jgi:hypothetical protein
VNIAAGKSISRQDAKAAKVAKEGACVCGSPCHFVAWRLCAFAPWREGVFPVGFLPSVALGKFVYLFGLGQSIVAPTFRSARSWASALEWAVRIRSKSRVNIAAGKSISRQGAKAAKVAKEGACVCGSPCHFVAWRLCAFAPWRENVFPARVSA